MSFKELTFVYLLWAFQKLFNFIGIVSINDEILLCFLLRCTAKFDFTTSLICCCCCCCLLLVYFFFLLFCFTLLIITEKNFLLTKRDWSLSLVCSTFIHQMISFKYQQWSMFALADIQRCVHFLLAHARRLNRLYHK